MDSYVKLEFNKIKLKSVVAKEAGDYPEWNHSFEFEINAATSKDSLTLSCLENRLISDDLIGTAIFPVKEFKD